MKKTTWFIPAVIIAFLTVQAAAAGGRVLLVHSYNTGYPWVDSITGGVQRALAGSGIQLAVFYMDTKRNTGLDWKIKSGEMAQERVKAFQPDVVIAADDNAQEFFAKKLAGQAGPQVVFLGVNADPGKYGYPAANITGILERPFVAEAMALLKEISPQAGTAAVITDKSETSDGVIEYIKSLKTLPLRIVAITQPETFKDWQDAVNSARLTADAIIFNTYHTVRKGLETLSMAPGEVIEWTLANNKKPTAGLLEFNIEDGVLCGVTESGEAYGMEAGEIARQMITAGKTAKDFPVTTPVKGLRLINTSAAANLGITIPDRVLTSADRLISGPKTGPGVTPSIVAAFGDEHIGGAPGNRPDAPGVRDPVLNTGKKDAADPKIVLAGLKERIDALFAKLNSELARAAGELDKTGLAGPAAGKILGDLCAANPEIIDCAAVDAKGIMLTVEPGEYKSFEGADISSQEQVIEVRRTKAPVLSKVFRCVEGFEAVDMEYPVILPDGRFAGAVSALLRPEFILAAIIVPALQGLPFDVWLMQQDGRILYDREHEEIGRMLFDDRLYKPFPSLLEIGRKIASQETGRGTYEFLGRDLTAPVKKETFWTSVGIYGARWRLVLTKQ